LTLPEIPLLFSDKHGTDVHKFIRYILSQALQKGKSSGAAAKKRKPPATFQIPCSRRSERIVLFIFSNYIFIYLRIWHYRIKKQNSKANTATP